MTTFEIFISFSKKCLNLTQEMLAEYLHISTDALKNWISANKIPDQSFFNAIKNISDIFENPNKNLISLYKSPENIMKTFVNYIEDNGYVVDDRQKAVDEFTIFLLNFLQNEKEIQHPYTPPNDETDYFDQSIMSADRSQIFFTVSKKPLIKQQKNTRIHAILNYIKNNPHTLLCEGGGCGKTVFLKRIEKEFHNEGKKNLVYYLSLASISCNQLANLCGNYREFFDEQFDYKSSLIISVIIQKYLDGKPEYFETFQTIGNSSSNPILLLLDGLNEVSPDVYSRIVYEISKLQNLNFFIILSSRDADIPLELQGFKKAYLSKVPEQLKSTLITDIKSKQQILPFVERIIAIPFYYDLISKRISKNIAIPQNEYELLDMCYMEYTFEHIKRLVNDHEEFDILCGVYFCIIPLLAYDMLKSGATYSIRKADLEEKIDFILSQKELCNVVKRTYMPPHFSTDVEIKSDKSKKYLKCLVN